jgi:serine O-acetyltransferase
MRIEKLCLKSGGSINLYYPENYKDCIDFIISDNYRVTGRLESVWMLIYRNMRHFDDSFLFWLRLCQYKGKFFRLFHYIYKRAGKRVGIYIPPMTRIGYGLDIGHGMSMVINGGTIIGNNVSLSHFMSIGTNHDTPAIIGDNVYIGPNSTIVEDVCIGSNVTIGAGSVVTKDIPSDATAVGSPAKVINYNNPARYIKNPYPVQ